MLGYLFADITCSENEARGELRAPGTDNVQGQIFEHIFKAKFKYLFSQVMRLDQSRGSENI